MPVYSVKVIPNSKKAKIEEDSNNLKVHVTSPASESRANRELIEILSKHFNTKKSNIKILRGTKSRDKLVEIVV